MAFFPDFVTTRMRRMLQQYEVQRDGSPLSASRVLSVLNDTYEAMSKDAWGHDRGELLRWLNMDSAAGGKPGELAPVIPRRLGAVLRLTRRRGDMPLGDEPGLELLLRRYGDDHTAMGNDSYERRGQKLFLTRSGGPCRLWYMIQVPRLHYGAVSQSSPASPAPGELWLNRSPDVGEFDHRDDIYEGCPVQIYEGKGTGQYGVIKSVEPVGAEVRAMVDWDEGGVAALDHSSHYALSTWFPEQLWGEWGAMAALRFLSHVDGSGALAMAEVEARARWQDWVRNSDYSKTRHVVPQQGQDFGLDLG